MGGFAALIGGLGQGAQQYGQQVRGLQLQQWGQIQSHLADELDKEIQSATTPERKVDLGQLRTKVLSLKPGEDPTKLLTDIQNHLTIHPVAAAAMAGPQQKAPPPGPTPVGQPAGTGGNAMADMIGGQGGASTQHGAGGASVSPPAAQPQTSPVSPAAQGGGAPSSPQPSSASAIAPVPQQPPAGLGDTVRNDYMSALHSGTMPAALQTAAQPFVANDARLDETKMLDQYLLNQLGPQRLSAIRQATPNWDQLPAYIKAGYAASAMGVPAISVPGIAQRPMVINPNAPGASAPQGQTEANGQPINREQGTVYRIERDPFSGQDLWYPVNAPTTITQTAGGEQVSNRLSGASIAPVVGAVPPSVNSAEYGRIQGVGDNGHTSLTSQHRLSLGLPSFDTGFTPPAMMPHTTESTRSVQTIGPDGKATTTFAPVSSTRTVTPPSGGHATVPPVGAGSSFPKPFTPQQDLTNEQQLNTITRAEGVMQRLRDNSHLMDSMIESGKLKLETGEGGLLRAVVAKGLTLTPAEAQFAGDFDTMAEDINLLRKPLGGAGFRSTEAWTALQGLKGSLLKNPEVTRRVMDNTLQAFEALRQPLANRSHIPPIVGAPTTVHNQAEFDALPKGAHYIEDGHEFIKK